MRFAESFLLVAALAGGGLVVPCHAAVPSPTQSFVAPCLIACPAGDIHFEVVVRDFANNPVANSTVTIEVCDCPTAALCPANPSQPYTVTSCRAHMSSDLNGQVLFPLQAGGGCPAGVVKVYADGVPLANRALASPDQDGSGDVSGLDVVILDAKIAAGTFDPTADLNCDGALTAADRAVYTQHAGHGFPIPTPVRSRSWGSVKSYYR